MPVDPTDPETFEDEEDLGDAALDEEVPEADAAEQHTEIQPEHDDPLTGIDPDTANEADAAEQARVVSLDEDDYR
ncbi:MULTISPECIES: hypothetical protein [unclassified Streptomyces]|jgi:hypothetical protein|uniref:hypothetical protein n=1 Tax=unclassified Streptomyces TaxID=2593676 RepID=UPI00277E5CBF|nr:hypothetical protein [Streptomyces sp. V1I1]MDQ0940938.1 hypothetical protein [Streptomyces sp. V1I1]